MDPFETIKTALEALLSNRLRTCLTMLGIVIGVGAVIALMSIGSGAQAAIAANIKGLGANLITITPGAVSQGGVSQGGGSATTLTLTDASAIADPSQAPDVGAVSAELNLGGNAQIVFGGQNIATRVIGVTPAYADVHAFPAVLGAWFTQDDMTAKGKVAMLGANVAQELFGAADPTGQDISMRVGGRPVALHVAGVLQAKGGGPLANVDDQVLIPLTTLQQQFSNPRSPRGTANVSQIVVQATSSKSIAAAKSEITALLLAAHRVATPDFVVQSQDDQVSAQAGVTQVLTILLAAVAGISLVVGGIGIMNIMIVSVTERTREIGIRKAIGAKRMDILSQFLVEALVVSMLGGLIGILTGVGASHLINGQKLNGQPIQTLVALSSVVLAAGVSLAIGLLFGVYPAYRASNLRPIEALRYESATGARRLAPAARAVSMVHQDREPSGLVRRNLVAVLAEELLPATLFDLDAVGARGAADPSPGGIALLVTHALNLVESRDRVAHVPCVVQRLLPLLRESELLRRQLLAPLRAQLCHDLLLLETVESTVLRTMLSSSGEAVDTAAG